jgi:hypothetical protein
MTHPTRTKMCGGGCGKPKPYDQFHLKTVAPDGRQYECKACSRSRRQMGRKTVESRTNQPQKEATERLYVAVPPEVKAKVDELARRRGASRGATVTALLRGSLANVEARYGPLDLNRGETR